MKVGDTKDMPKGVYVRTEKNKKKMGLAKMGNSIRTTHGESRTRIYRTWSNMLLRCFNEKTINYARYGGRGITVCDEWKEYIPFRDWALVNGYTDSLQIDRIDNNNGYYPANCRWVTVSENAKNRRTWRRKIDKAEEETSGS